MTELTEIVEAKKTGETKKGNVPATWYAMDKTQLEESLRYVKNVCSECGGNQFHSTLPSLQRQCSKCNSKDSIAYTDDKRSPYYEMAGQDATYINLTPHCFYHEAAEPYEQDGKWKLTLEAYTLASGKTFWLPKTWSSLRISVFEHEGRVYVGQKEDIDKFIKIQKRGAI